MAYVPVGIDIVGSLTSAAKGAFGYLSDFGVSLTDIPTLTAEMRYTPDVSRTRPAYRMMVRAFQKGLSRAGYFGVAPDGVIGKLTMNAATSLAGSGWQRKSWGTLFGLILAKIRINDANAPAEQSLPEQALTVVKENPIPTIAVVGGGVLLLFLVLRRKKG